MNGKWKLIVAFKDSETWHVTEQSSQESAVTARDKYMAKTRKQVRWTAIVTQK
jgi:hypothetical protein